VIYCHQLVAAEAFAWIVWILLTMWLVWVLVRLEQVRRSTSGGVGQAMDEV
jgi:hypothetical protein